MKTPIIEGLKKYIHENNTRFHMPGHKGKSTIINWKELIPEIDVTEVEGTDNLHNPQSIIKESQELAAKLFKAKKTLYSVNGTTGGIYGAISATTKPGDRVLIQRNCHRAVYNAIIFNKLETEYIYPRYNKENNIVTGILPKDVEEKLKLYPDIQVVIITNPSYYGICSNVEEIANIVHKYNKILIVDEAHGSHLTFSDDLPKSALECGADISIQSTHKTLPAFTQASMVHVGSDKVDIERLQQMLSMYQSTSPSYLLMASLDVARAYMEKEGRNKLDFIVQHIKKTTDYLKKTHGVEVFDRDRVNKTDIFDFDITKLLISVDGLTGSSLETILRKDFNIQLEMSDYYYGLALCSVFDEKEYIDRLVNAVMEISKKVKVGRYEKCDFNPINMSGFETIKFKGMKASIPLHTAFYRDKKMTKLSEAKGEASATFLIPYPPGVPILCPGEVITKDIIDYIEHLKANNIQILGFTDIYNEYIETLR